MSSILGQLLDVNSMDPIVSSQSNQSSVDLFGCDENGKCIVNESGIHDRSKTSKCWIFNHANDTSESEKGDNRLSSTVLPQPPTQSTNTGLNDDSFVGWDDDDEDELITAIDRDQTNKQQQHDKTNIKRTTPSPSNNGDKPDDVNDDDDELSDIDEPRKKRGLNHEQVRELLDRDEPPEPEVDIDNDDILNGDGDLDDDMDVGRIKAEYLSKVGIDENDDLRNQRPSRDTLTKKDVEELLDNIPKPMVQKSVQPGASPEEDSTRFLCWNTTGIIRAQYGEYQCIDVMFHDSEKHSSVNFRNEPNYTFGSLSDDVIVMGTNGKYGTGPAAVFGINLLENDREQREWQINLPHVELIEGLAAGQGFVAIVSDKRYLRLLTHGGMQSYVLSLPGQLLCLNAHEQNLLLMYHNGSGQADDQNLSMATYHIDILNNKVVQLLNNIPVALSKRSPLAWAGFTDEGVPATSDYHGVVRIYKEDIGKLWHPVLDFRELSSSALDHFFVVGVSELRNGVRAVKCSKSRYPDHGQDIAAFYQFTIPLCDLDSKKVQLEEEHVRLRLARSSFERLSRQGYHLRSVAMPYIESNVELLAGTILKLFSIYLNDDKEEAARNLVSLMPKEYVYKLPEYAWHTKRPQHFIESLNRAIEEREKYDDAQEDIEDNIDQTVIFNRKDDETNNKNDDDDVLILKPKPLEVLKNRQDFTIGSNGQLLRKKRKNVDDDDDEDEDDADDVNSDKSNDDCVQVSEDENDHNENKKKTRTVKVISDGKSNPFKRKR